MHQPELYALRRRIMIVGGCLMILLSGCRGSEDLSFHFRDAVRELPEKQQVELKQYLERYFGTATKPLLRAPDLEAEAEVAEVGEDGSEQLIESVPVIDLVDPDRLGRGQLVFNKYCAPCHGITGDGMGPASGVTLASGERIAYLDPRPRDYRLGKFKFTSTPRGYKPRRSDLARIIHYGAKGTSMPAFRWLSEEDLEPLIDYVILLSQRGELEKMMIDEAQFELEEEDSFDPEFVAEYVTDIQTSWADAADHVVLPVTRRPPYTDESILAGRQIYLDRACAKCHGQDGRGNRTENVGKDDWGQTAFAADLSAGMLHGGRRPVDIYRRIYAGINGTPMPGFGEAALADQPEKMWDLVHYIMSIVENREVEGLDQLQPTPTTTEADSTETPSEGSGTGGDESVDGSGTAADGADSTETKATDDADADDATDDATESDADAGGAGAEDAPNTDATEVTNAGEGADSASDE